MKEKIIGIWENEKLQSFINENKDIIMKVAAAAVLVVAAFFVFVASGKGDDEVVVEDVNAITETEPASIMIMVDIGGEVVNPMVAELSEGSRVEDAIKAAGGITEDADLTDINRAAFLADGDKIMIPSINTDINSSAEGAAQYSGSDDKININTADSEELQKLDGVGPVTAEKIIEYRNENGRFNTIDEIKNVSGIGEKTFEKFQDDIKT